MDVDEQIKVFREFIEQNYYPQLLEAVRKGQSFLVLDFSELIKFNTEIIDELLEAPEDLLKAAELAVRDFDLPKKVTKFNIRLSNLPESLRVRISEIRSKHLNKLIWCEGVIRQKSDVRPHIAAAKFECPSCGNVINIIQLDKKYKEPTKCSCGRKGKFKEIARELVDGQGIVLEESADDLEGNQPKRINIFLKDDLVSPLSERRTGPGSRVKLCGWVGEVPIILKTGGQSTKYDLIIEANYMEPMQDDFFEMKITEEEEEQFKELGRNPNVLSILGKNIAPSIYGHDKIKEALVLQLAGGCRKTRPDSAVTRGDIHILLIGDPGSGKSQLLKRITAVAPKARFTSGKGASLDYREPIIIKEKESIKIKMIGDLVEENCIDKEGVFLPFKSDLQALAFNPKTLKLEWRRINYGYKHKTKELLYEIELETGRSIVVTKDHSIFGVENGNLICKEASKLKKGDTLTIPSTIKHNWNFNNKDIACLLGYFIAEGNARSKDSSYKIEFTLNKKEQDIVKEIENCSKRIFNQTPKIYKKGVNAITVILYGKEIHNTFKKWLGSTYGKHAKEKRVPNIVFNMSLESQKEFIRAYIKGDGGVTKSKDLMSDLLYLFLNHDVIAGCNIRKDDRFRKIGDRIIKAEGLRFDLKSPHPNKKYCHQYKSIPLTALDSEIREKYCKNIISSKYTRFNWERISHPKILERLLFIGKNPGISGPELTKKYTESVMDYISKNSNLYFCIKKGRTNYIYLTSAGEKLYHKLNNCKSLSKSDFGFCRIKDIKRVKSTNNYVYDISIKGFENFIAGFGGIICHNTAAGLTASVVKDEFLGGWSLEAGTLVLANRGFAIIDEMDKMGKDDRSALHEALEQQSYHPETEIMLDDGSVFPIGSLVNELMEKSKEKIIKGINCEILRDVNLRVLTTDFQKIWPIKVDRVSRHVAPRYFIEIEYSHGRKIKVTPEHPIFVFDGKWKEVAAEKLNVGCLCPIPKRLPTIEKEPQLNNLNFDFPNEITPNFARFLGYQTTEGHTYYHPKNHYAEIGISNTSGVINNEVKNLMGNLFHKPVHAYVAPWQTRKKAKLDLTTTKCCSLDLYRYFQNNFMELTKKATKKRIPNKLMQTTNDLKVSFLATAFKGDGFIDSERFGYSTSSYDLAKDYQQMLLNLNIFNYIAKSGNPSAYKVVVSGNESMGRFVKMIVGPEDERYLRLNGLIKRSQKKNNDRDVLPCAIACNVKKIMKKLRMDDGYFNQNGIKQNNIHRKTVEKYLTLLNKRMDKIENAKTTKSKRRLGNIQIIELAKSLNVSSSTVYNLEKKGNKTYIALVNNFLSKKMEEIKNEIRKISSLLSSELRFASIKSIRKIPNENHQWVYDVTVEPNHTFISEGLVLHNTVSISKANIQATLRCETTVLAAANPKLGRFDPYDLIAKQIDLPPTLINRFDLIFPIKDLPNREKDELTASFILAMHKDSNIQSDLPTLTLRKYFAYIRQKMIPKITDQAIEELKAYYVGMRNSGSGDESGVKTIPITARQLEALVRLAEASAKVRLSKIVSKKDAQKAIEMIDYCLNEIAKDKETGTIDIDRIGSRITASQRSAISIIKEIISGLEAQMQTKIIPVDNIIEAAQEKNISKEQVEDTLEKLRRSGDLFEPKKNFVQKL